MKQKKKISLALDSRTSDLEVASYSRSYVYCPFRYVDSAIKHASQRIALTLYSFAPTQSLDAPVFPLLHGLRADRSANKMHSFCERA